MAASAPLPVDLSGLCLQPGAGLSRQLYQALRERMLDGRLPGGTRLPASRQLAELLGVSRNTVNCALDQLYAEGYVHARVGDGTYVADLASAGPLPAAMPASEVSSSAMQRLASSHLPPHLPGAPRAFRVLSLIHI